MAGIRIAKKKTQLLKTEQNVTMVMACPHFWLGFFIVPTACLIQNVLLKTIKNTINRSLLEQVRKMESSRVQETDVPRTVRRRVEAKNTLMSQNCGVFFHNSSVDTSAPRQELENMKILVSPLYCLMDMHFLK
ncbi:phospholipid-transporting ATPase IB-like isoform X2 [Talpa occidentalis]|uniref:phospholipid-transporting ATPase IB-like isoform X2 n=1 Tax=Talpa occidentalis TaxID=50954 RepID=UPI0023FA4986|nr:phospholipid-transporting ATPase IB-like isoform X2 [Talpa occidentalis]